MHGAFMRRASLLRLCLAPVTSVPRTRRGLRPPQTSRGCHLGRLDASSRVRNKGSVCMISRTSVGLTGATARPKQHACPRSCLSIPAFGYYAVAGVALRSAAPLARSAGQRWRKKPDNACGQRSATREAGPAVAERHPCPLRKESRAKPHLWPSGPAAAARSTRTVLIAERPPRRRRSRAPIVSDWSTWIGESCDASTCVADR